MGGFSRTKSCIELSGNTKGSTATNLYLPTSPDGGRRERLVLPSDNVPIDEYLSRIPRVASRARELHQLEDIRRTTTAASLPKGTKEDLFLRKASSGRCLNVLQGEVAHASTLQSDVIVSAEATTCHVVALRSTKSASVPLVSLAHVDQAGVYDHCFDAMVQEHVKHHSANQQTEGSEFIFPHQNEGDDEDDFFFFDASDEENDPVEEVEARDDQPSFLPALGFHKSVSMPALHEEPIEMELHLVGGYLDKEGTSRELSNSLVTTFSQLADKYQKKVRISLSTAAISCMNTEAAAPRSRGLGIDTHTGEVFPIHSSLPKHLEGPGLEVRSARSLAAAPKSLHVIHDRESHGVTIEPFAYKPIPAMNALLKVPDDVLLQYTSTSPDCESDRFCSNLRRTVSFVNSVDSRHVFGNDCQRPLVYTRSANNLNEWQRVAVTS